MLLGVCFSRSILSIREPVVTFPLPGPLGGDNSSPVMQTLPLTTAAPSAFMKGLVSGLLQGTCECRLPVRDLPQYPSLPGGSGPSSVSEVSPGSGPAHFLSLQIRRYQSTAMPVSSCAASVCCCTAVAESSSDRADVVCKAENIYSLVL